MTRPIELLVFDMDGVLVDTEPVWKAVEVEVYGAAGVPIDEAAALATKGLRMLEVAEHWRRVHPYREDPRELAAAVRRAMLARLREGVVLLPGARDAVAALRSAGVPLALASSSPLTFIEAVLAGTGLAGSFDPIRSADDLPYGKPHPEIYLATCAAAGVKPADAVAIEDSLNGVLAAKSARMRCIAVPEAAERTDPRFAIADRTIASLRDLTPDLLAAL